MTRRTTAWMIAAAAGSAMTVGSALAQPQLINISGSSLLQNFISSSAATNDYIGVSAQNPPAGTHLTTDTLTWSVDYRVSGSVNGFNELINWGYPGFYTVADDRTAGNSTVLNSLLLTDAWYNGVKYINGGNTTGVYNLANAGGQPHRANTNGADRSVVDAPAGGVTIDIAYLDVPSIWAIRQPGKASATRKPLQPGYGENPRASVGIDGSAAGSYSGGGLSNQLTTLGSRNLADDPNRVGPFDSNTIFELPLTLAPVAPIANLGTGVTQMKMSEIQWLFATGRAQNGENFVVCTRDIGSGTRNDFCNGIALDPSFGVGDNIGLQSTQANQNQLGPHFWPTNKGATGGMLNTLRSHRLGIGYAGAETGLSGASPSSWLVNNSSGNCALEIIDTQNDIASAFGGVGSSYVRPTLSKLLDNTGPNGWVISAAAHISTIGDPLAEPVGIRTAMFPNNGGAGNSNPQMVNKSAARYVNNIYQSILAFDAVTPPPATIASPGEFLATNFVLLAAAQHAAQVSDSQARVVNPDYNVNAYNFTLANNSIFGNGAGGDNPRYVTRNSAATGFVPTRETTYTYSDGIVNGLNYVDQSGATVTYGTNLTARNKIAYDFNGDGVRSLADAPDMIAAWRQRNGGPTWTAPNGIYGAGSGQQAVIEILGDGNGDGSFTTADIRYWADGLALNASNKVDRKAGFIAVDTAFGGNFFGTTKPGCSNTYNPGDSRADIYGPTGKVSPGAAPTGADGVINSFDIDYVFAQMRAVGIAHPWTDGLSADWNNLSQAAKFDLSADINGDLRVNRADVEEILSILGTRMGDVNLDGVVNAADRAIITAHLGQTNVGWAGGDLNGDGVVDAADLALACPADFDGVNGVQVADIFAFLNSWFAGDCKADFNGGGLAIQDIFDFLNAWFAGC